MKKQILLGFILGWFFSMASFVAASNQALPAKVYEIINTLSGQDKQRALEVVEIGELCTKTLSVHLPDQEVNSLRVWFEKAMVKEFANNETEELPCGYYITSNKHDKCWVRHGDFKTGEKWWSHQKTKEKRPFQSMEDKL